MEINIPFNEWSIERLLQYRKFATSRNKKYGSAGDIFLAAGMKWKMISVQRAPLKVVASYLYEIEGADSPMEFIAIWDEIHPVKKFDPEHMVWVHFFFPFDPFIGGSGP